MKHVIFFRPERFGDMLVTLPIVDGLKKHYPHLKVSLLASPKNLELIKDDPRFDKVFLYTKSAWRDLNELFKIRSMKFDCVIDTICDDSVTALFLANFCAAGAPVVGVGKDKYKEYYSFNFDNRAGHIIDNSIKLLKSFDIEPSSVSPYAEPHLNHGASPAVSNFVNSLGSRLKNFTKAGLNLSSGAPTRVWQKEKWIKLIKNLQTLMPEVQFVLITVPKEREFGESIKREFESRIEFVPDNLGIIEVAAIIKRLDILISPDTSLVHIARAMQVPVVGLYSRNAKNFNLWHPYGQREFAVNAKSNDDIFDITVEQVQEKFQMLIDSRQAVRR
jgi:ADP-heptose:LPS heptosyltransferase